MRSAITTIGLAAVLGISAAAPGTVTFYDLDGNGNGPFFTAIGNSGYAANSETEWEYMPDWHEPLLPLVPMDGPVDCNTNNAIFAPGDIPFNLAFDSNLNGWGTGGPAGRGVGGMGLIAIGPSDGFGNPSNALVANYFDDSFDVMITAGHCHAVALWCTNMMGNNTVDLTVYDKDENVMGSLSGAACPAAGHRWGILATPDEPDIWRVNIYDSDNGAEGTMKVWTWDVPAPASFALLGLAGLIRKRRR